MRGAGSGARCAERMSDAEVAKLVAEGSYMPEKLGDFEALVATQAKSSAYWLEANLALLRLYQFYPDRVNSANVAVVLAKGLQRLPENDFHLYMCLLDEQMCKAGVIPALMQLQRLAETCDFAEFWEQARSGDAAGLLQSIVGFKESMQDFVAVTVGRTARSMEAERVVRLLGVASAAEAAEVMVGRHGWTRSADGSFTAVEGKGEAAAEGAKQGAKPASMPIGIAFNAFSAMVPS